MPLNKIISGQPFPGGTFNTLVDLAKRGAEYKSQSQASDVQSDIVTVRNDDDEDLPRGGVVGITDMILSDDEDVASPDAWWFSVLKYSSTTAGSKFGVLRRAIPESGYGKCQIGGIVPALVNITSTVHEFVKVENDSTAFESCLVSQNGKIVWKPSGTGIKLCAVQLSPPMILLIGKTAAAISKGASGTVSRYSPATLADTGDDDTCTNLFAPVASGKWVAYLGVSGVFFLIAAEC